MDRGSALTVIGASRACCRCVGGGSLPALMAEQNRTPHTRTASYLAEPGEVHRVLLLYSGGLDTSVMLKWIQDEYDAEVVALTVNLGQPGEDYDVVQGKAIQLGAVAAEVVDAREEFAARLRRAGDQGQRDLRPRLSALHRARPPADRQARGRLRAQARLRHDRPRLHRQGQRPGADRGDGRDARARAEGHRAGTRLADGPRGGDRLRARARHPDQGRRRARRRTRSTTTSGAAPRRARWIEELDHAPDDDVFQLVTRPEVAPDEPEIVEIELRARRARWRSTASAWGSSSCSSAPPRSAAATASGSSTTSRTASSA